MEKEYRINGAIGALLDEYEKVITELTSTISKLKQNELELIVDHETEDENCRSIQTILSHVVESGFAYAIEIRKWLGEDLDYREKETLGSAQAYNSALHTMFSYTEKLFKDYPDITLAEFDVNRKIKVRWGQSFDVEQLMEHAIVHILRHRRQIEIFKAKINQQESK